MWDFLSFRRMLIPYLIQIIFWAGTAFCVFSGILIMAGKATAPHLAGVRFDIDFGSRFLSGLAVLVGGPLVLRIWCELFIVLFRINETLTEMSGGSKSKK